jgi:tetratricopeptide (TPR) repeat protein
VPESRVPSTTLRLDLPRLWLACLALLGGCGDPAPSAEAKSAFARGRELYVLEKPFEAIAEIEKAVRLAPDWGEAHAALGKLLVTYSDVRFSTAVMDRQRLARAIGELERAAELMPTDADAAYWVGFALRKADGDPRAVTWLSKALERKPDHGPAEKELGLFYAGEGDSAKAVEHLTHARALLPKDDEVLLVLGMQLESEDRLEEARDALVAAAEMNTAHPGPRFALIGVYRRLGDPAAAERMGAEFERCRALGKRITAASQRFDANSQDPAACMGLAELYREVGMHPAAIQWAERALRLDPKHAPAIELLRKLGKPVSEPENRTEDGEVLEKLKAIAPAGETEGEPR